MTSLADGLLKKKAPSTQIKTWIIFIPVKTVTLRNICVTEVLKKKKKHETRCHLHSTVY